MNRAVGDGKYGIKGNKPIISYGGKLVRELLESDGYVLLNNLDIVEGGPWTFISRADPGIKSCLDLVIVSRNLLPFVSKMVVDKERNFTPYRIIKRRTGVTTVYTDHLSLKVILTGMPSASRNENDEKETVWNMKKSGAWKVYEKKTKEAAEKLDKVVSDDTLSIDEIVKKLEKTENKIKYSSFGKTRKANSFKRSSHDKKGCGCSKINEEKCLGCKNHEMNILKTQSEKMEKEIMKIKECKQGRVGQVFKMKGKIMGNKKAGCEPHAIKDPVSDELLVANEDIKKATLSYCVNNLKKASVEGQYNSLKYLKKVLVEEKLKKCI